MRRSPDLRVALRPSRRLPWLVSTAHLLAIAAAMLSSIPSWAVAVLLALVGGSLAWQRRMWRKQAEIGTLILRDDGTGLKVSPGGTASLAEVAATVVWPWLVILHGRRADDSGPLGRPETLVILADGVADADEFRRLRRWLIWVTPNAPA